ncbi:MAG: MMPL family transporter, partial [Deltaproteobacteria bacterium]|nr:MMPL family transporter [Deltaproteobacteria bacterium]
LLCLLLPLASVLLTLLWTLGLMAWTGTAMSMLTMIVPVFLIAVGTAYCLHLMSDYVDRVERCPSRREAVFETFSRLTLPTALAVLTTAIGIGSLLVNRIVAIREFAIFSCFGIFSLLIILLTFFPSVLVLAPTPTKKKQDSARGRLSAAFIELVIRLNLKHQRVVLPVLGIVALVCGIGVFRLQIQTNPIGYFKENTPVSRHFHDIYRDMSGSFPINVFMSGSTDDYFEDPEHVADIARFQKYVETLPEVDKTISFADYLKLVNYVLNRFNPEYYALPTQAYQIRMLINNYKIILGEEMLTRFMNPNFSATNILLLTHISSSRGFLRTRDMILAYAHSDFSKDIRWDVTGFGIVLSASSHLITTGQVKSLSLTVVLVFGIMFLLFLSSKVGLIAIVPNLFPIVINFGIMGWFGIELSMVTSLIAGIAIGLAVDDTIHYLVRYNIEFKKDLDDTNALAATLRHVGRPIVFTSLTISLGFSVLAFSSFNPTAVFGVLMVITMISALVGDLMILPSLMQHVELVTIWDLLRLKLGKAPELGIPLFRGLTRTQLHYILMAGALRKSEAGEVLFRKGDASDSMYAVVSGGMDVVDHPIGEDPSKTHGIQKLISHIAPGDLVGEMGLLRSAPRSATVIVTEPSELLQINWKMLKRLQWLYPPAAHKLFYNLMSFLCDRLQQTTECLSQTSHVDGLTGFYDRDDFLKILEIETYRARRYGTDLSLCLLGIEFQSTDHHPKEHAKDQLLKLLGRSLSKEVRDCDTLARIDARTLALLLPQTSLPDALPISDRLRRILQGPDFQTETLRITIQTGVAGLNPGAGETGGELLAHAVSALEADGR